MKQLYKVGLFFIVSIYSIKAESMLSSDDAQKLGAVIWNNEADKRTDLLVFWSPYASFPEVGIGHYIWYPEGQSGLYTQQFPALCQYMQEQGVQFPTWLHDALHAGGAPWQSREEYLNDDVRTNELRTLLAATIEVQTAFMIKRLEDEWPTILEAAPIEKRSQIKKQYMLMRCTLLGTYSLVDYLNFKGSGLNPHEERKGERWGLLQVLMDMPDGLTEDNVTKAFAISAANRLVQLISNSGPEYKTVKFLAGWIKRVSTYTRPNIFGDAHSNKNYISPLFEWCQSGQCASYLKRALRQIRDCLPQ